jgi:hypothetical protein
MWSDKPRVSFFKGPIFSIFAEQAVRNPATGESHAKGRAMAAASAGQTETLTFFRHPFSMVPTAFSPDPFSVSLAAALAQASSPAARSTSCLRKLIGPLCQLCLGHLSPHATELH